MGSWRKVGAFLGLVPDDANSYDHHDGDAADRDDRGRYADYGTTRSRDYDDYGSRDYRTPSEGRDAGDPHSDTHRDHAYAGADYRAPASDPAPEPAYRSRSRRGFAEEPVTQGALAVQTRPDTHRDAHRDVEPSSQAAVRPVTVKLTGFAEARIVGEKFRDGQSVILDMTEMDDSDARRLVDFAAGLAFALRGSIDKVTNKVFMLLPSAGLGVDFDEESRDAALADARKLAAAGR